MKLRGVRITRLYLSSSSVLISLHFERLGRFHPRHSNMITTTISAITTTTSIEAAAILVRAKSLIAVLFGTARQRLADRDVVRL
jgi:hypothetical protein